MSMNTLRDYYFEIFTICGFLTAAAICFLMGGPIGDELGGGFSGTLIGLVIITILNVRHSRKLDKHFSR